ncbi:MAG TPA: glycine cleavage system protein H [Bryobacteraceae bacterium]|nr:glycine cleavage system protein H [Bryobacteraceae bacterium]HPT25192.1 glycine cleavage system protein H [Bryobacteraceae bacterium]
MTVLFVVLTFAIFIVADLVMNKGKAPAAAHEPAFEPIADAEVAGGYAIPSHLRYHPGHTWLERERKNVNRVGMDAFAAAYAAGVEKIELPKAGQWVRQGQKVVTLHRNGEKVEIVSPVEGEVVEVNGRIAESPALLGQDPYGEGWLMTVFAPDDESPSRNLLPASLVGNWMRETADRFFALQPQLAGTTAADGGEPVKNAALALDAKIWARAGREFFLS